MASLFRKSHSISTCKTKKRSKLSMGSPIKCRYIHQMTNEYAQNRDHMKPEAKHISKHIEKTYPMVRDKLLPQKMMSVATSLAEEILVGVYPYVTTTYCKILVSQQGVAISLKKFQFFNPSCLYMNPFVSPILILFYWMEAVSRPMALGTFFVKSH